MKEKTQQTYKLLVLDLDGTLTNSQKEISASNLQTLLQLQQTGVKNSARLRTSYLWNCPFGRNPAIEKVRRIHPLVQRR